MLVVKYSSDSLGAVAFPTLSKLQDDRAQFLRVGLRAEKMTAFIAFGLLGWLYLVAAPVILLLLGDQWRQSIDYFKLLCLSGFAYPVGASILSMLKASGDSKAMLKLELLKKILLIAGLIIGFGFGIMGYLYSLVITGFLSTLLNMYMVGRALDIPGLETVQKHVCVCYAGSGGRVAGSAKRFCAGKPLGGHWAFHHPVWRHVFGIQLSVQIVSKIGHVDRPNH
jgi:hypothetical protein